MAPGKGGATIASNDDDEKISVVEETNEEHTSQGDTTHSTSNTTTTDSNIVGRCIDCSSPHDVYSGFITCTVCRMPVLVCPSCVRGASHPGEYHCVRHRLVVMGWCDFVWLFMLLMYVAW